jgi:hypothetical protein
LAIQTKVLSEVSVSDLQSDHITQDIPRETTSPLRYAGNLREKSFGSPAPNFQLLSPSSSSTSSTPKESKATTLPSFKELQSFPKYLPSPVELGTIHSPKTKLTLLEMSGVFDPNYQPLYNSSPDQGQKQTIADGHDPTYYSYNHRTMHGEPSLQAQWRSDHARAPPTIISPHEMYINSHHPGMDSVESSSFMMRGRKPTRNNPDYVKRPRRKAEEVERVYDCNYEGCDKAYGALNHLNTHVRQCNHGPKREPKGRHYCRVPLMDRVSRGPATAKSQTAP